MDLNGHKEDSGHSKIKEDLPTAKKPKPSPWDELESAYAQVQRISDQDHRAKVLKVIGDAYHKFYKIFGRTTDLDKAISVHEEAMQSISALHPRFAEFSSGLGVALMSRFDRSGVAADSDRVILLYERALEASPDKAGLMRGLAASLLSRYEKFSKADDLDRVIITYRMALDCAQDMHHDRAEILSNLGCALEARYDRLGTLVDLEQAISLEQQVVELTSKEYLYRPGQLHNLANILQKRCNHLGSFADLEQAISLLQNALELISDEHQDRPNILNNLGNSFQARFKHLGNLPDLEQAISLQQTAVDLTLDEGEIKSMILNSLGHSFQIRFSHLGSLVDLEQAISLEQNAVDLAPNDHPIKSMALNNLAISFQARFNRLGSLADIEQAISLQQKALDFPLSENQHRPGLLSNLGNAFRERFLRLGNLTDLEQAITYKQNGVNLTPDKHTEKPIRISSLAVDLQARSVRLKSPTDLEQAVSLQQNALNITPPKHPDRMGILNNLGNVLEARFVSLGSIADLEQAITFKQNAVDLIPNEHPDRPSLLSNLGNALQKRYKSLGGEADLEKAMSAWSAAASSPTGTPIVRLEAARQWAKILSVLSRSPMLAFDCAINLLPRIAWLGLPVPDQHAHLAQVGEVVRDAMKAAIQMKEYKTAVEWAEQGRSIWQNLLGLRSPLDDLRKVSPDLADQLEDVSLKLERSGSRISSVPGMDAAPLKQVTQRASQLAAEWEKLVDEVRKVPTFEYFLKSKSFDKLAPAAREGPVVILNVHHDRCDALVLISDTIELREVTVVHIPLTGFSYKMAEELSRSLNQLLALSGRSRGLRKSEREGYTAPEKGAQFKEILGTLWLHVAKPVIDSLKYRVQPDKPPHIWWCATGPLAFLPIHAAGIYDESGTGERLSNYVVSSYTPTLTAILRPSQSVAPQDFQLLTISQPSTPNASPLPGTKEEVRLVENLASGIRIESLTNAEATVERVLRAMERSNWIHLACHGQQDRLDSMKSGFLLHDKILRLSEIIRAQLPKADFAFLSACQTATGDENVAEESIHLAAGMLFSGCRGVVATMWSIDDGDAPQVAADVYGKILEDGKPDRSKAAYALHQAVQRLQKNGADPLSWVPFIHIGR